MVNTFDEAREILKDDQSIALDLETSGFSPWQDHIHVIVMYGSKSRTPVILHYPRGKKVPIKVLRWLEEFEEITTHNGTMFDILFLANIGMEWQKVKWWDTLIGELAVITAARRNLRVNLQASLKRRTGKEIDKNVNHESWGNEYLDTTQINYLYGDIAHLLALRNEQVSRALESEDMMRGLEFEMSLIPAVVQMELNGLPISVPTLNRFLAFQAEAADRNREKLEELLEVKIIDTPPKNVAERRQFADCLLITSPKQLKNHLCEMFGERSFPDTTAETLQHYLNFGGKISEVCRVLLDFKHADRRENMYAPKWQRENIIHHSGEMGARVHGKFWQIGTDTGRFSSSNPNLQQIPRDMRAVFAVDPEYMIGSTDYSGIEVRVAASLARDEEMIKVFSEGRDIHTAVGASGFGIPEAEVTKDQRQIAKAMSFTLLFGGGAETFRSYATARGSTISIEEAELAVERFFETFQGIARMRQSANWKADNLRAVTLRFPTGLKRVLFNESLRGSVILNNIVQGTAAAGLKFGLKRCWDDGLGQYVSAVVHDEIVYVTPKALIEEVRDEIEIRMILGMQDALEDSYPIPVEVESEYSTSWAGDETTKHVRVMGGANVAV